MTGRSLLLRALVLLLALAQASCSRTVWRASFVKPEQRAGVARSDAPFLEVHTHAGEVYVLEGFSLDEPQRQVRGKGIEYDASRKVLRRGALSVSYDEVALLETNRPESVTRSGMVVMGLVTGRARRSAAVVMSLRPSIARCRSAAAAVVRRWRTCRCGAT